MPNWMDSTCLKMINALKRGDYVRVRLAGTTDEWAEAFVALASESNPSSVMLLFNGGAVRTRAGGSFLNGLPLSIDYENETVRGLTGDDYEMEVRGE
jgi:hypothetical protein